MFQPFQIDDSEAKVHWQITPLFPKPISISFVKEEACKNLKEKADETNWFYDTPDSGAINNGVSSDKYILDSDEELKEYLLNFCASGLGMLGYTNEIQMTTSWFTVTNENGMSRPHKHTNSWYSGVLYFDDYDDTSSLIHFSQDLQQIHVEPTTHNYMNSSAFRVHPMTGMLLMFPSETMHQVLHGLNTSDRRSLAFNIMPKGQTGNADSTYFYQ